MNFPRIKYIEDFQLKSFYRIYSTLHCQNANLVCTNREIFDT